MTVPEIHVTLVDENNQVLGTMPKSQVHTSNTPLHRAFSLYIFNANNQLLLQQRSHEKLTWPGIWSNSLCGHVQIHESNEDAVRRHLKHELGIMAIENLTLVLPDFRYRAELDGIVENEICPVFCCRYKGELLCNPDEVANIEWIAWSECIERVERIPDSLSPWMCMEVREIVQKYGLVCPC